MTRTTTIASALCAGLALTGCASGGTASDATLAVDASVTDVRILNPGAVVVDFDVSLDATAAADVTCTVTAGGSEQTVTIPDVAPETVQEAQAVVDIADSAAETVASTNDADVACTSKA